MRANLTRRDCLTLIPLTGAAIALHASGVQPVVPPAPPDSFPQQDPELVRGIVGSKSDAIGYLGLPDYNAISNNATILALNGVKFSHTNVNNGSYGNWGYEHMVNRAGGLSAQKAAVRDAIKAAITNPGYQSTNSAYFAGFSSLADMHVERGADGAVPTSLDF